MLMVLLLLLLLLLTHDLGPRREASATALSLAFLASTSHDGLPSEALVGVRARSLTCHLQRGHNRRGFFAEVTLRFGVLNALRIGATVCLVRAAVCVVRSVRAVCAAVCVVVIVSRTVTTESVSV